MGVTGRQDEPSCPFGESKNLMEGKRKTAICIKQEARYLLRSRRTGTYMARMEGLAEVLRSACSSLDKENSVIPLSVITLFVWYGTDGIPFTCNSTSGTRCWHVAG